MPRSTVTALLARVAAALLAAAIALAFQPEWDF
jgi:hypothetical protein